jgi:hypothetical protein
MKSIAASLLLLAGSVFAQQPSKPQISPLFDPLYDGPAFFVECRNTSGQTLAWRESLRVDGVVLPDSHGPLTMGAAPGETWRGILGLRQSNRSFTSALKFGAIVKSERAVAISEGKHTIAVQCGGVWSDDITFFWEGEAHP